jgi:hypothetical protein
MLPMPTFILTLFFLSIHISIAAKQERNRNVYSDKDEPRKLQKGKGAESGTYYGMPSKKAKDKGIGKGSGYGVDGMIDYDTGYYMTLKFTNLAYKQPLGPFFVMTHDDSTPPLFVLGEAATLQLATLAETGDPQALIDYYTGMPGAGYVGVYATGAPFAVGGSNMIDIPYNPAFPYLTVASMVTNTNDGFVSINGALMQPGDRVWGPVFDSGSEINNELCTSIVGPACMASLMNTTATTDGNGEGAVHIHRGIMGLGNLPMNEYDWKNPMVLFQML